MQLVRLTKRSGQGEKKYIKHYAVVLELTDGRFELYEQLDSGIQEPRIVPNIHGWTVCGTKRDTGKLAIRAARAKASEDEYSALSNNCECYARYLYCGIPFTLQGSFVQIPLYACVNVLAILAERWMAPIDKSLHEGGTSKGATVETGTGLVK